MARKHGGLGRGLDALIPQSAPKTEEVTVEIRDHEAAAEQTREETTLRVSQIEPNRSQPRKTFDEDALEELADSIRQYGLIQPIMVQKREGYYEIIAGERRWRACMKAGLKEVPVIIREYDDQKIMELSLIENLQREDLNPMEEARAYKRLMEEFGLTQEEIAGRVSKSRPVIANALRLLKLDERVQAMVEQGEISMGHARALASVLIPEEQYLIALKIMEEHLTVRDTEKIIKNIGKVPKKKEPVQKDESLERIYRELENRLKSSLGTKVAIHTRGTGGGKVEIDFYTAEDLEKIIDRITSE